MKTFINLTTILLLAFWGTVGKAENSSRYVSGEGRFYSKDDDSIAFVKKQLTFNAFQDVLTKELKSMGLKSELFWKKFDEKFDEYFKDVEIEFKKSSGLDEESRKNKPLARIKRKEKEFKKQLRIKKLNTKRVFGKVLDSIQSYSVKNISRSTRYPNSRYIRLQAKVDRKWLNLIYYKFTHEGEMRHFAKMYLTVDFQTHNMSWSDVGVEISTDLTGEIEKYWKKWLEKNLASYVDEVVLADHFTKSRLEDFWKIPQGVSEEVKLSKSVEKDQVDVDFFKDTLWLKMNLTITKKADYSLLKERSFSVGGNFTLIDMKTNLLVDYFDFINERHKFSYKNNEQLRDNVANMVYRLPLVRFSAFGGKFQNLFSSFNRVSLRITNVGTIQEVFRITDILKDKGIAMRVNTTIKSYIGNDIDVELDFFGTENDLNGLLRSLNEEPLEGNKVIEYKSGIRPLSINIKDTLSGNRKFKGFTNEQTKI